MTYEAFLKKASEAVGYTLREDSYLEKSWVTGGITGGSCWGAKPDTPVEAAPEPEFDEMDKILEAVCPQITFLQYKRICAEVIVRGSYRYGDYYGNCTTEAYKRVYLREFYHALKERGLLDNAD